MKIRIFRRDLIMMMKIWEHVIPSVKNDRICDDIAKWRCHHCVTVQMFQVSFETFHENVVSWLTRGLTMIPEIDFYEMTSILRRISRLPHRRPPTLSVQGRQSGTTISGWTGRDGQVGMDRSGWTGRTKINFECSAFQFFEHLSPGKIFNSLWIFR